MFRTALATATLLLAAGCLPGGGGGSSDIVSFDRLDIQDIDWDSVDADFVLDVNNPTPLGIDTVRFDYTLYIDGIELMEGYEPDGLDIGGEMSTELAIPAHVDFDEMYDLVRASRGEDTLPFAIEGTVAFDTEWGPLDLPFEAEGDFPALRVPGVRFDRVRLADVGWDEASLDIDLAIDNDHGSDLWFDNVEYDFFVAGVEVADGRIAELGGVEGASTGTLSLPVDVEYLGVGEAVWELVQGEPSNLGIAASADVDTPFGVLALSIDEEGNLRVE